MPYLDYAGAAPPSKWLLEETSSLLQKLQLANPHSAHSKSRTTAQIVDNARQRVLRHFNTSSKEYAVIFTNNTSHSLKIVAECFTFPEKKRKDCEIKSELPSEGPIFAYFLDSHHSVVGMREIVRKRVDYVSCLSAIPDTIPHSQNSLIMLTGMSNFCGRKYDLNIISEFQAKGWNVCLDAAALVSCSRIDLNSYQPEFLCFSFYKMFGLPTGVGALLIRKDAVHLLHKPYFAGGTVAAVVPSTFSSMLHKQIENRFEDGTINYYSIALLQKGFDEYNRIGGVETIGKRSYAIAKEAYNMLKSKYHCNGAPAVEIYCETGFVSEKLQGPIVSFNLKRDDGSYTGYAEVSKMANLFGIDLRTGCFCNTGACQKYLNLSNEMLLANMQSGKRCGDEVDLIDGRPTGAVRVSFGKESTHEDVLALEQLIDYCFLHQTSSSPLVFPHSISDYQPELSKIFCYPIKSCRGFEVESAQMSSTGLAMDRQFMIVSNDVTLSVKQYPQMSGLSVFSGEGTLELRDRNDNSFELDLKNPMPSTSSVVCVNVVSIVDCGDEVSQWISEALNVPDCRLRAVAKGSERSLTNEAPYLLVNEASAKLMAEKIGLTVEEVVNRFRPNFVVRGLPPFIEDTAISLNISGIDFKVMSKCTRCEMICVDPKTGEKDPAMIVALRNYRNRERMTFGIYIKEIGDSQRYLNSGDPVNFKGE